MIARRLAVAALLFAPVAVVAPASAQRTPIAAPAGEAWRHDPTGMAVPATLAGLPRGDMLDLSGGKQLDVMAQYGTPETTELTLYLFRPGLMDASIWFDRIETQVRNRPVYGTTTPTGPLVAFTAPGAAGASALRRSYLPGKPPYAGTAAALMPFGRWLVGLRISSTTLAPAEIDAQLTAAITGLGWPAAAAAAPAPTAAAIAECATPIAADAKAKLVAPSLQDALLGAGAVKAAESKAASATAKPASPRWCRSGPATAPFSIYRNEDAPGYVIAFSDAGTAIEVGPSLAGMLGQARDRYSVSLHATTETLIFPDFNRLPAPAAVIAMVQKTRPVASVGVDGKAITVDGKASSK